MAAVGGVTKTSQVNYEKGHRFPDAAYLARLAEAGCDVLFVLTGNASPSSSGEEADLISRFRAASPAIKAAALAVLGSSPDSSATAGVHVAGDQLGNVNTGTQTNTAPLTFNVGRQKKGSGK